MSALAFYAPVIEQDYIQRARSAPNRPKLAERSASDLGVDDEMKWAALDKKLKASIESLLELGRIGEDWDGDGARAPIPELIDSAIQLIRSHMLIPARVVPINDGRIALDFYFGMTYLSARIDDPGQSRVMIVEPDGSTRFTSWKWSAPTVTTLAWAR